MKTKCKCGKEIESKFSEKEGLHFFFCSDCKIGGKAKTEKQALDEFQKAVKSSQESNPMLPAKLSFPEKKDQLLSWAEKNMELLFPQSAQFMEKPATQRMIVKNIKYILKADLKDVWNTEEGRSSIEDAFMDSLYIGATLPEMGSIIPYGKVADFIPGIEAFEHALTTGKNPPFSRIIITCIFENDKYEITQENGEFHFEIKKIGFPRGDIIGVVVQCIETDTGKPIGEAMDKEMLMKKAERHSVSYRYYLQDMADLRKAQSEGKDYIEKWNKKFYEKDIQNPYVGPDQPKMLMKLAGKSYLWKYLRMRNARAMATEWGEEKAENETHEQMIDRTLNQSMKQFEGLEEKKNISDAEIVDGDQSELFGEKI